MGKGGGRGRLVGIERRGRETSGEGRKGRLVGRGGGGGRLVGRGGEGLYELKESAVGMCLWGK